MPIGYGPEAGSVLAYDNAETDRDFQEALARKMASQGDPRIARHIAERRQRAAAAVLAAKQAHDRADRAVRAEIAHDGLSGAAANTKHELEMGRFTGALQRAQDEQKAADTVYGEQVRAWQRYDQLTARKESMLQRHQQELDALDREMLIAQPLR